MKKIFALLCYIVAGCGLYIFCLMGFFNQVGFFEKTIVGSIFMVPGAIAFVGVLVLIILFK